MSGPYDDLAVPQLVDELPQLVKVLSAVTGLPGEERVWVVYGSRVTGSTTATSDFDVMVLHRDEDSPPIRLDGIYRDAPVTIYALPWSALQADGEDRAYGGYFALKLFSPFVCSHPSRYPELVASVAQFLAPMAADIAKRREVIQRTRHQILADSYLAFLTIYPDFDSYAARSLPEPVLASALWLRQAQVVVDAYEQAQLIKPVGANRYVYCTGTASEDICHQRAIAAARFWAFGAVCHGADPGFPGPLPTEGTATDDTRAASPGACVAAADLPRAGRAVTDPIADWHAARNVEVAAQHAARACRFGLQPLTPSSADQPAIIRHLAARTAWAWQPGTGLPAETRDARVGIAGRRLHLGHLSLAKDVSWLQENGYSVTFVGHPSRTPDAGPAMEELIQRVKQFGGHEPSRMIDLDAPAARAFEDQVLSALTLGRMRQVYGWDADTPLRLLQDAATMMSFFLYSPGEAPGVALVDAGQAPHTALMKTVARRLAASMPHVAYRRLVPDLQKRSGRASVHDPDSTIFLEEPPDVVRRKFMAAITGGRASADEQRDVGGDLAACPTFEMIELLCSPERATAAARRCRAGDVLCRDCKAEHADEVVAGFHPTDLRHVALRAGTSRSVPAALLTTGQTLHRPPPRTATALEADIARYAGVAPEQVVVGHGTTEIIDWIMREQATNGRAVLATSPTFELYAQLAVKNGLRYDQVPRDEPTLRHNPTALAEAITDEHVALVVDIPHTVSGTSISLADLVASVVPRLSGGAKLIIDNVYGEFMAHPLTLTSQLLEERDELVVCRSLSKAHCLLGARVGYALTSAAYADRLRRHQLPYGISSLAATAAHASLQDDAGLRRNIAANRQAYALLTSELDRLHLGYTQSEANFLLIDLGDRRDQVLALLRACGLRFRDGARWQLPAMIQVHLIDEATVAPLVRALRDLR